MWEQSVVAKAQAHKHGSIFDGVGVTFSDKEPFSLKAHPKKGARYRTDFEAQQGPKKHNARILFVVTVI